MRRILIGFSAAVAAMAFAAAQPTPSPAQADEICNPVMDRARNAVVDRAGNDVVHRGSFVCPPEPEPVVEPAPPPPPPAIVISGDVLFEFDRSTIRPQFFGELDRIVATLREHPDRRIRIEGHTDSVGTEQYNQGLSERRAQAVADYFAERGIARNRMVVEGHSLRRPVASNATAEGRRQNRRVEIHTL